MLCVVFVCVSVCVLDHSTVELSLSLFLALAVFEPAVLYECAYTYT
jgi:hypothetical protein